LRYERESQSRAWPALRDARCLPARAAVDAPAQQIYVAAMLLNKVGDRVYVDRLVKVQVGVNSPCRCDLAAPGFPRCGDNLVVGHALVEVQVRVLSVRFSCGNPICPSRARRVQECSDRARWRIMPSNDTSTADRISGKLLDSKFLTHELEGHPCAIGVLRTHGLFPNSGLERLSSDRCQA
jgi:hypothetical protein